MTTHFRTCNLCEAMCGLAIEVEDGRIASIEGDPDDPFSGGHLCPKGVALKDLHEDPDRLRRPVRRTASGWDEIGWDEALDEAARGLHRIQAVRGADAVATYLGNPSVHNTGALMLGPLLLKTLRTRNGFSATSVDQLPSHVAALLMLGHRMLIPIPDVDRTDHFLVLGANPVVSGGSLMSAPGMDRRLAALRKRGGRVVVVDPRRTETARVADEHHFIRPGADALFLLSLLHELLALGPRLRHLEGFADGLDALRAVADDVPPERSAPHTGIAAETVRRLARDFHAAPSAVAYGRVGLSTQPFGGLCAWLLNAINAVTGNLDRAGGAMLTRPAFDVVGGPRGLTSSPGGFGRHLSRVRGLPEFGGELPVVALAEEILTPGPGQVRGLLTFAGNPVLSTPNGGQLDRALASLEFMVAIDPYVNETTRHATLILPPVSPLERGHYDLAFHVLAVRNTARYSPPLFDPPPGSRHDWQIALELRIRLERLARGRRLREEALHRLLMRIGPEGVLDAGLRLGPYGLTMKDLARAPHGLDLGPLEPCLPDRLATKGKRLVLAPAAFVADVPRLLAAFSGEGTGHADGTLSLIGRRGMRDNNSWMHNAPRLMRGKDRCTLAIHPDDAAARALADGDLVDVTSRVGSVRVPVAVSDEVMPGVVSLPHGYGHGRPGVDLAVAAAHPGASVNDLTDDQEVDALTGNAAFSGVRVTVEPVAAG